MDTDRDTRAKSKTTFYDGCVNGMIHRATFQSYQLEDINHHCHHTMYNNAQIRHRALHSYEKRQ